MKDPKIVHGIFIKDNKTFYYLESGRFNLVNSVDRLKNRLLMKGIIKLMATGPGDLTNYKITNLEEAQTKGWAVEVIYLNDHIRKVMNAKPTSKEDPWK